MVPQRSQSRGRSPSCGAGDRRDAPRSRASSVDRGGRNIIAENRAAAGGTPRASSAGPGRLPPKEVKFARDCSGVPMYLDRVKASIAHEERIVAQQLGLDRDPNVPPGHRLLSEDERHEIMAGLDKRKVDLDAKYARLPLQSNTQAQKQRAHDLEKALREVEVDIARFSKPRILLKL